MSGMKDNFTGMKLDIVLHKPDEGQYYRKEAGFCPSFD
ncbi:hypothetical protein QFZ87_000230 [Bacillus sp. SLBN-46]|nr:hypothetical protein [Bacillus sp. SLBN-46]